MLAKLDTQHYLSPHKHSNYPSFSYTLQIQKEFHTLNIQLVDDEAEEDTGAQHPLTTEEKSSLLHPRKAHFPFQVARKKKRKRKREEMEETGEQEEEQEAEGAADGRRQEVEVEDKVD